MLGGAATLCVTDTPSAPKWWRGIKLGGGFKWRLMKLRQEFVTCVVCCLEGSEGMAKNLVNSGLERRGVTGVTVYGCVSWGHEITALGNLNQESDWYEYRRWAEDDTEPGKYGNPGKNYFTGSFAPPHWWSAVRGQQNPN